MISSIKKQVLKLSVSEQLELLSDLEDSLQNETESIRELWINECSRRLAMYKNGEIDAISEADFFNSITKR